MAVAAQGLFDRSLEGLRGEDPADFARIVAADDEVDAHYLTIEGAILDLLALQPPVVATDLRLLTSLIHINGHLERVGDMAVNIAKIGESSQGLPRSPTILVMLDEMGGIALRMLEAAMDALARRDIELARTLPAMDDPIDLLNRGMVAEVLEAASDPDALQWAASMHMVARMVERVGDHAVDIGEQVAYLVTGEFQEFTDATHPEPQHPAVEGSAP